MQSGVRDDPHEAFATERVDRSPPHEERKERERPRARRDDPRHAVDHAFHRRSFRPPPPADPFSEKPERRQKRDRRPAGERGHRTKPSLPPRPNRALNLHRVRISASVIRPTRPSATTTIAHVGRCRIRLLPGQSGALSGSSRLQGSVMVCLCCRPGAIPSSRSPEKRPDSRGRGDPDDRQPPTVPPTPAALQSAERPEKREDRDNRPECDRRHGLLPR